MRDDYKERSQPKFRAAKVGALPKKKDYVIRAAKQNAAKQQKKETLLKIEKKNPHEYYSYMKNAKKNEKTGITEVYRLPEIELMPHEENDENKKKEKVNLFRMNDSKFTSKEQRKIVQKKTEGNLNLLKTRAQVLKNQLNKLIQSYSGLNAITIESLFTEVSKEMKAKKEEKKKKNSKKDKQNQKKRPVRARNDQIAESSSSESESDSEDYSIPSSEDEDNENGEDDLEKLEDQILTSGKKSVKHTIFVDDESELQRFDPEERFDTDKSLLSNPLYRLKKAQLKDIDTPDLGIKKTNEEIAEDVLREQLQMKLKAEKILKIENAIKAIQNNRMKLFSKSLPGERKK